MTINPNTANICHIADEFLIETSERIGMPLADNCHYCASEPIGAIVTDGEITGWHPTYQNMDSGDLICRECSDAFLNPGDWL